MMKNKSLPATGTIRSNKIPGLLSPSDAEMAKKDCGFMSVCSENDAFLVCWVDKKVVTIVSNNLTLKPSQICMNYSKAKKT